MHSSKSSVVYKRTHQGLTGEGPSDLENATCEATLA